MLLFGEWKPEDFLIVEPEQETIGLYDWDEIIGVKKTNGKEEREK
jgi:hypothetical protein